MELIYAIADALSEPNERVRIDRFSEGVVWFHIEGMGARFTCRTVRNGKYLKKNSIRADFS